MRYYYDDTIYSRENIRNRHRHLIFVPSDNERVLNRMFDVCTEEMLSYIDSDVHSWLNENFPDKWSYDNFAPYGMTIMFTSKEDAMAFKLVWG